MTDSVTSTTATDAYGNTYTTAVSNDSLESEDFITLMLTELSLQDPTSPVDSSSMLDSQLELSTLEANIATVEAMESLQSSFEQTALSSAASLIGTIVENGETDDSGDNKQYSVSSVEGLDGEIYLTAYQITGFYDVYTFDEEISDSSVEVNSSDEDDTLTVTDADSNTYAVSTYGLTYEELAEELSAFTGITASVAQNTDGTYQMVVSVSDGSSSISQNGVALSYSKDTATSYNSEAETVLYSNISKIY